MQVLKRNIGALGGPSNIVKLGLGLGCYPPERQDRMEVSFKAAALGGSGAIKSNASLQELLGWKDAPHSPRKQAQVDSLMPPRTPLTLSASAQTSAVDSPTLVSVKCVLDQEAIPPRGWGAIGH